MPHAIDKLPKWAREIIERQERQISDLQNRVAELTDRIPETDVFQVLDHGYGPDRVRIVKHLSDDEVIFSLPNPHDPSWEPIEVGVMIREESGRKALVVNSRRGLTITPRASNMVYLRAENY